MAYGDYSQAFGDLGDFISRLILAHREKQRQDQALANLLGASQQNVTTPAPVGLPLPAQPGSMNPPRLPVPQIPVMGVPSQSNEQTPLTDPRLQAAFMQMFKENPQMAQGWMGMRQQTQPTYEQKEIPRGGTLTTFKQIPGQPPQQVGETKGQPFTSVGWTPRLDENGKPVTQQFGQTIRTVQDEIDRVSGQKTGNWRYAPGGTEGQMGMNLPSLLKPEAVERLADAFQTSGQLPNMGGSFSVAGMKARADVINRWSEKYPQSNPARQQQAYKMLSGTLNALNKNQAGVEGFTKVASANMDNALAQSGVVARTGSPLVNRYQLWTQRQLSGDPNVVKFETYIYTAAREYARVMGGGALSQQQLHAAASAKADELLSSALNPEQLKAAIEAMKNDMANMNQGLVNEIGIQTQKLRDLAPPKPGSVPLQNNDPMGIR